MGDLIRTSKLWILLCFLWWIFFQQWPGKQKSPNNWASLVQEFTWPSPESLDLAVDQCRIQSVNPDHSVINQASHRACHICTVSQCAGLEVKIVCIHSVPECILSLKCRNFKENAKLSLCWRGSEVCMLSKQASERVKACNKYSLLMDYHATKILDGHGTI